MMGEAAGQTGRETGLRDNGQGEITEMLILPPTEPAPWEKTQDKGNNTLRGHRGEDSCFKEGEKSDKVMERKINFMLWA